MSAAVRHAHVAGHLHHSLRSPARAAGRLHGARGRGIEPCVPARRRVESAQLVPAWGARLRPGASNTRRFPSLAGSRSLQACSRRLTMRRAIFAEAAAAVLTITGLSASAQRGAALALQRSSQPLQCQSVVVVRCDKPTGTTSSGTSPSDFEDTRKQLLQAAFDYSGLDSERIVIVGARQKPKAEILRDLLQAAAPPIQAMSFRTVENPDGTRCTCASAPCVLNCCVCSSTR